jgi:aminoglycoside phosphotransferase (APT) family kinase protein
MSTELQAQLRVYCYIKFDYYDQVEVNDLSLISSNPESSVYAFNLNYQEKGADKSDAMILKTFSDDVYGKDRTLKERHALKQLHYRGYPVPRPIASEIDAAHIGMPFIIMERVPGKLLGEVLADTPEAEQQTLLTSFVQLLVDLHTMNLKALVENLLVQDEYTLIKRELYNLRTLVAPYDALAPVLAWLNEHRDWVPCSRPSINHRDFHPWNVLLTDEGKLSVIDWGWQISDPRADLAWLLAKLEREGMNDMSAYVLAEYERLDGAPVEHLDYFKVLANLRWLVSVAKDLQINRALQNGASDRVRAELQPRLHCALAMIESPTGLSLPKADELLTAFKGS